MSSILLRYTLKQYLIIFFATLFVLTTVIMLFDVIELLRSAAKRDGITFLDVGALALLKSPQMIFILLPFVALIAGMIFFFRLSHSSELIVMRAVGLSVWNFMMPLATAMATIGILTITLFNPLSAWTARIYERLEERLGMTSATPLVWSEDGFWLREVQDDKTLVMRASRVRQEKNRVVLDNVSVFELAPDNTFLQQIEAPQASLKEGMLVMGPAFVLDPAFETGTNTKSIALPTTLNMDRILEKFDAPQTMSLWRFPKFIRFLEESGFSSIAHRMYFHELIAFPFFLVAMIFVAAVFGMPPTNRQGGVLIRVISAIVAGFLLYFFSRITNVLGMSESLPLFLAAWGPALISIPLCTSILLHLEDG